MRKKLIRKTLSKTRSLINRGSGKSAVRAVLSRTNVAGRAVAAIEEASGRNVLRASLRRVKKRWSIPGQLRERAEDVFQDLFGKSPRGTTWTALAERYPERFREYLEQAQEDAE